MKTTNANEERVDFSVSVALFWIKGYISVDNKMIKTSTQNTIAGIIPAGQNSQVFRLDNVQGSSTHSSYKLSSFVWGAIIALIGFSSLSASFFFGLILLVIGIVNFLNGIINVIVINGNGSNYSISIPFFEKGKIEYINSKIQDSLAYSQDAHDNNRVMANANQNTNATIEAIRGQNVAQARVEGVRSFCSSCGSSLEASVKFCPSCGSQK
ncbi:zinc ribbon domain-containing protein [Enterococcus olivae]